MSNVIVNAVFFIMTSALWGATNPFIKAGGKGIETIHKESAVAQFFAEIWFLMTTLKYMVPFLINQAGSVLYYVTLSSADISLAVPITNSLTFIFTGISGRFLGEEFGNKGTYVGMFLVLFGITLCVVSKLDKF